MDLRQSRIAKEKSFDDTYLGTSNMATLTMREPSILPSPLEIMQEGRYGQYASIPLRSRSSGERIALPSIRQAVPEIELRNHRSESSECSSDRASYSPIGSRTLESLLEHNPLEAFNKRRRVSSQEGHTSEPGEYPLPRMFPSPQQGRAQSVGPSPTERYPSGYSVNEPRNALSRGNSYQTPTLPAIRSPPRFESPTNEFRPTLPNLPCLTLDHRGSVPRGQGGWSECVLDASWLSAQSNLHHSSSTFSAPLSASNSTQHSEFYGYEQPRGQSYSGPSMHAQRQMSDRSLFHSRTYYLERPEMGEMSGMEATKHRKRRGNLPKETTDKLRAWFVAHLHHPYPTEDEKQDLMRQTKLQMNQISNWFINARRRQLPAMINNARVESDARSAQAGEAVGEAIPQADELSIINLGLALEHGSECDYEDDGESLDRVRSSESSSAPGLRTRQESTAGFGFDFEKDA